MKISKELENEIKSMETGRKTLDADTKILAEEIQQARDSKNPKVDVLDKLLDDYRKEYANIMRIKDICDKVGIIDSVNKYVEKHKNDPIPKMYSVDGALTIDEALGILKFRKDVYNSMCEEDPFRLKNELRWNAEKQAFTIQTMMINTIPLPNKELLKNMDPKERTQAFKVVFIDAMERLKKRFEFDPIEEVDEWIELFEPYCKILEFALDYGNTYQANSDSSDSIDEGLEKKEAEKLKTLKGIDKDIESKNDRKGVIDRELNIKEESLRLIIEDITNKTTIKTRLEETVKSIEVQIENKRNELKNVAQGATGGDVG